MENSVRYTNQQRDALLQSVESIASTQGDYFTFFYSKKDAAPGKLKNRVATLLPDAEIISTASFNGQNIVITRTQDSLEQLASKWQQKGNETLTPVKPAKKKEKHDLIKVRGYIGIFAQVLMILSGYRDSDKQAKAEKDGAKSYHQTPAGRGKINTSILSFVGYGINSIYGVQKEMDHTRLRFAKQELNQSIGLRHGDNEHLLPSPSSTKRTAPVGDEPSWMQRNSIRFGSAIKLASKVPLLQLGALKNKDEKKDNALALSGWFSIIGKVVSLTGLPEDPFQLEKNQDPISYLRRRSNFISSLFDWTSTLSLFMGSFYRKKKETVKEPKWYTIFDYQNHELRETNNIQWWQLGAAVTFFTTLIVKAVSPYTNRKLDVDNLNSHATLAIASTVQDGYAKELAQLTTQMMQTRELPEIHKIGFAATFVDIANRLEQHHGIALHSPREERATELAKSTEIVKEVEKTSELAAKIAKNKPNSKLAERLVTSANELSESVSSRI